MPPTHTYRGRPNPRAAGGRGHGVIPEHLRDRELAHSGLTELHVVKNMHERKALMADLADGFVALPGGIGTLEELFEAWTWGQLGLHQKPCAIYNVNGFFDPLLAMAENMERAGFLQQQYIDMLIRTDQPDRLHRAFQDYQGPGEKWL